MKNKSHKICCGLFLGIFLLSCNKPKCTNKNLVFDKYSPQEKEYKNELAKQLKSIDNAQLTYFLDKYQEINNKKFLSIEIQGQDLCAKILVEIRTQNDKIANILKAKGLGYSGAELKNLKIDIQQEETTFAFVYENLEAIID